MAAFDSTISNSDFFSALKGMAPFKSESKALGGSKKIVKEVVKQEISSPLQDMSKFFAGIDNSLINLVNFAKQSFQLDKLEAKDKSRKKLAAGDTDKKTKKGDTNMLDSIKESFKGFGDAFGQISVGEKLGAALLIGGLLLFNSVQDQLVAVLTPIVAVVKKMVEILGPKGTFMLFLSTFLAIKFRGLIKSALGVAKSLAPGIWKGIGFAFNAINKASGLLLDGAKGALKGLGGGLKFLFDGIGKTFTLIRTGLVAMKTGSLAMLGPILPAIAIAAAIGAVLFSLKSSFEVFKTSLDEGDSMLTAIGKAILDFFATLVTLPITLVKNLVGFIAGLFGFDNFKEKLDNFSFKDALVGLITGFMKKVKDFFSSLFDFDFSKLGQSISGIGSTIANIMKALGKGALAFVKAIPKMLFGGEHPTAAFGRVYNEVRAGGSDKEGADTVSSSSSDTSSETNNNNIDTSSETNNKFETKNLMKEKVKELIKEGIEKERIEREIKSSGSPIMVNASKQGDVYNQKSETNVTGEIATEHSDPTSIMIRNAVMVT